MFEGREQSHMLVFKLFSHQTGSRGLAWVQLFVSFNVASEALDLGKGVGLIDFLVGPCRQNRDHRHDEHQQDLAAHGRFPFDSEAVEEKNRKEYHDDKDITSEFPL
jgi:hypothetical protein